MAPSLVFFLAMLTQVADEVLVNVTAVLKVVLTYIKGSSIALQPLLPTLIVSFSH